MFKNKYYRKVDIIIILFKTIPFQSFLFIFTIILNSLLPAYQTITIGYFVDTVINIFNSKLNFNKILLPIFLITLGIIIENIFPLVLNLINIKSVYKLDLILREQIILKKLKLQYKYIEKSDILDLMNRISENITNNFISVLTNFLNILSIIISTISLLWIIMSFDFFIGLLIIIVSVPLFFLTTKVGKENYKMNTEKIKVQRKYMYLENILKNREYAQERKLFNYSDEINTRYGNLNDICYKIEKKIQIKTFINLKLGSIITLFISLIIISFILISVYNKQISVGIFMGLVNAIFNLCQTMSWQLTSIMVENTIINEYLKDFSKFINLDEKEDANTIPKKIPNFKFNTLEFKNVSFKYPDTDKYILKNCSFKLLNNKTYGFVGENGAGKTTIVKLLTGLYDNYEGDILINDKNIKEFSFSEIKSMISVAYQDFAKYYLTIKENILFGDILKNDELEIDKILIKLNLTDKFDSLPNKLNTYLGKIFRNSIDLSGGLWQRLSIARLLYSNSPINILDEPTASLDPIEENRIYEIFKKVNLNKFTIYITHRLGIVKTLDEILVLKDGKIIEKGTHLELIKNNGLYKEMFENQKYWYK